MMVLLVYWKELNDKSGNKQNWSNQRKVIDKLKKEFKEKYSD